MMAVFVGVALVLVITVLGFLLRPFLAPTLAPPEETEALTAHRRQLDELEADIAAGTVAAADAEGIRAEIARRLLAAADRRDAAPVPATGARAYVIALLAALVPLASAGIYLGFGHPMSVLGPPPSAVAQTGQADLAESVRRLGAKLAKDPNHLDGWVLYGRTLAELGRYDEARTAFERAIAMSPDDPALHAQLGETIMAAANGVVGPAAEAEFRKGASDPSARFYLAIELQQHGDTDGAKTALTKLLADAPADASWRGIVAQQLEALGGKASAASPGPNAEEMAAAATMAPGDQQAMIRGMVERLAAKLEANPDDAAGWVKLARAYGVLGESERQREALAKATARFPNNLELLDAYGRVLAVNLPDDSVPPAVADVMRRIHDIDANAPLALWFLGLDAANRGDKAGAKAYWSRLLEKMPKGTAERAKVESRFNALG
jgi:cytochrome c-type biogenesis protein CcmH